MRFKRFTVVAFALLVLSFFLLNTWQGYRYERLKADIEALERDQKNWLERNKKIIAALAVLSSPERIDTLAQTELNLMKLEPQKRTKLVFESGRESSDE